MDYVGRSAQPSPPTAKKGSMENHAVVWTALYYAFSRRLLPVMVARLVFNAGPAIAAALNLIQ
jgi:hypothetical protein